MHSTPLDIELVKHLHGLYVGLLYKDEVEAFERCVKDNLAIRDYEHTGGDLGLAKVKWIRKVL